MNRVAIAMQLNDRRFILAAQWPTMATIGQRLKRKAHRMAMAIIPLPCAAMA